VDDVSARLRRRVQAVVAPVKDVAEDFIQDHGMYLAGLLADEEEAGDDGTSTRTTVRRGAPAWLSTGLSLCAVFLGIAFQARITAVRPAKFSSSTSVNEGEGEFMATE